MARIKVKGTKAFVAAVRRMGDAMLAGIAPALLAEAGDVLAASQAKVPVGETGELKASGFTSGPVINPARKGVTVTCGYAHPMAGPIHEGVHGTGKVKRPPKFLKKAAAKSRKRLAQRVLAAAQATLATQKR